MTPNVIIAIVLVVIIIGGFIFLQVRKKKQYLYQKHLFIARQAMLSDNPQH